MTPRKRAIQVVEEVERAGNGTLSFQALSAIERAIIAAVEAEREACASIAEDAIDGAEFSQVEKIARYIRARSNGGEK